VGVDDGRHDGLAGEIHAPRAGRYLKFARASDRRDAIALNDERRSLDDRAASSRNQAGVFENRDSPGRWLLGARP
jgi:hypothetical protein